MNALLDDFEEQCRQGSFPRIAIWLEKVANEEREEMLVELLTIDVFYRDRLGSPKSIEQYLEEFSEFEAIVRDVIERKSEYGPVSNLAAEQATDRLAEETDTKLIGEQDTNSNWSGIPEIESRFDCLEFVGAGGMGSVYKVRDKFERSEFALKVIKSHHPVLFYRTKSEFRALRGLLHPNLIKLHELFVHKQVVAFTMEFVEGQILTDHLATLSAGEQLQLMAHLADGLNYIHDSGMLHRDLKPSNVMVTKSGRIVLLDFGLAAKLVEGSFEYSFAPGIKGTLDYMSPEQAMGNRLTPASDWYSFGVVMFKVLSGLLPFEGRSIADLVSTNRPAPADLRSLCRLNVSDGIVDLTLALLNNDETLRPNFDQITTALAKETREKVRLLPPPVRAKSGFIGRDNEAELVGEFLTQPPGGAQVCSMSVAAPDTERQLLSSIAWQKLALLTRVFWSCEEHVFTKSEFRIPVSTTCATIWH